MHPTREELTGLALGHIDEYEAEQLTSHIEQCPECEETLQALETAVDDVIVQAIRQPAESVPEEQGAEYQRLLLAVADMGKEPSFSAANEVPVSEEPQLDSIRDYQLLEILGRGGMGTVYKALHTRLDKVVALKVLPADRVADQQAVRRFEREMKAVGKLRHPNIVQATDAGHEAGRHYLVMELVDGLDLSKFSERMGPLNPSVACGLIRQAADGLQHAHERGLVHRDIKPSNLMLNGEGEIKILDLGLALLAGPQQEIVKDLTSTGQFMGTIDYMAPEQGGNSHKVDIRADLYSLGATLYKLLTGQAPFGGDSYDTPMKKITALATTVPDSVATVNADVPGELSDLVDRLLSKAPADRVSTPAELSELLRPFADKAQLPALFVQAMQATRQVTAEADTHSEQATSHGVDREYISRSGAHAAGESMQIAKSDRELTDTMIVTSAAGSGNVRRIVGVALCGGILFAALYFSGLFRFQTKNGEIYVDIPDGVKVSVLINGDEAEVDYVDNGQRVKLTLEEGNHDLVVTTADGIRLMTESDRISFKLSEKGKVIKAWFAADQDVATANPKKPTRGERETSGTPADAASYAADRRAAEWLIAQGAFAGWELANGERNHLGSPRSLDDIPKEDFVLRTIADFPSDSPAGSDDFAMLRGLKHLASVQLNSIRAFNDEGLLAMSESKGLKNLDLNLTSVTEKGICGTTFPKLESLKLPAAASTDAAVQHLARSSKLTELSLLPLTTWAFTDDGVKSIGEMESLESLRMPSAGGVTNDGLAALSKLSKLSYLQLYGAEIGDEQLTIFSGLTNLTELSLPRTNVSGTGLSHLQNCEALVTLDLGHTNVTAEGLQSLKVLPQIQTLDLRATKLTGNNLDVLVHCPQLKDLTLLQCKIDDKGLEALAQLKHLATLDLRGTQVTVAGITRLQHVLSECKIKSDFTDAEIADWGTEQPNTAVDTLPVSNTAFVTTSAKLPGVKSWTIDTREPRGSVQIEFHPTRPELITLSPSEGIFRIYSVPSGKLLRLIPVTPSDPNVKRSTCSADGTTLVYSNAAGNLNILDCATGKTRQTINLPGIETNIPYRRTVSMSPDGRWIATPAEVGELRYLDIVDVRKGRLAKRITSTRTKSLQFSQDSQRVLAAGESLQVVDVATGESVLSVPVDNFIEFAQWAPDEQRIVTTDQGGFVRIRDTATGKVESEWNAEHPLMSLAWADDGETLIYCHPGKGIGYLSDQLEPLFLIADAVNFNGSAVRWNRDIVLDSTAKYIAVSTSQFTHQIALLDAASGQMVHTIDGMGGWARGYSNMEVSPDGQLIGISNNGATFAAVDVANGTPRIHGAHLRLKKEQKFQNFAWSPDSKAIVSTFGRGHAFLERLTLASGAERQTIASFDANNGHGFHRGIDWSTDGTRIALTHENNAISIYDAESGKRLYFDERRATRPQDVAISPDGKQFAVMDGKLSIHDMQSGEVLQTFESNYLHRKVSYNHDGTLIGTSRGIFDAEGLVFDIVPTGKGIYSHAWARNSSRYCHVVFLSKQQQRATTRLEIRKDDESVVSVAAPALQNSQFADWALEDRYIVATGRPGQVAMYESATGEYVRSTILTPSGPPVSISADGHYSAPEAVDNHIVYVIQTDEGFKTLTPEEFNQRFDWTNDPHRVGVESSGN